MPSAFAKRNLFGRKQFTRLQSQEMGALCPFYTKEVYPGDTLSHRDDAICRLAAMLYPVYDFVDLYFYYFFVPYRLIWDDFEKFIVGYDWKTKQSVEPVFPYIAMNNASSNGDIGTLKDYFGFPVQQALSASVNVSALKYRAYAQIVNDWFINEFLQEPLPISTASGADTTTNTTLFYKNWPRDYFTSGLPFTQVGDPVTLPVGSDSAPVDVFGNGKVMGFIDKNGTKTGLFINGGGDDDQLDLYTSLYNQPLDSTNVAGTVGGVPEGLTTERGGASGITGIADLSSAFATSVNDVRMAFQLQRIQERLARNGVRFVEYIVGSFGVRAPDARLQRAEYLGGGKSPILVSEVLQTGASQENSPQGNVSGHGFGAMRTPKFTKSFVEHGIVIGLVCVMPRATYSQGLHRHDFANRTRFDFLQPELAHLGEQPVYNKEIYLTGGAADDEEFSYQPRYEDFRRDLSTVAGDFRTNMQAWYFGRTFASAPALNAQFVTANPSKLPFAAGNQADRPCWLEIMSQESMVRPLPKKGVPGYIDH